MLRKAGEYPAHTDDGRQETLIYYRDFIPTPTGDDPNGMVEGVPAYRTRRGQDLTRLEKGVYQFQETGEILRSDDPNAP